MRLSSLLYIPIAIGLFFFPSMILEVALDGAGSTYYGFPIPWNSRSLVSSLSKDIYLIPLLLDVLFYMVLAIFLARVISRKVNTYSPTLKKLVLYSIWGYGFIALAGILVGALIDPVYHLWFLYDFKVVAISLGPNI